jgi:hypothetical protein
MSCDHNVSIMIMFVILNARLDTGSTNKVASNCKTLMKKPEEKNMRPKGNAIKVKPPSIIPAGVSVKALFFLSLRLSPSPSLLSLYSGGRSSLYLPPQSSLYIPASAKSSKRTAKIRAVFARHRHIRKKLKKISQMEDPPLFPTLSKHSPLPQCKKLSSIMDRVSWMKRNE